MSKYFNARQNRSFYRDGISYKKYLSLLSTEVLLERINAFRMMDFHKLTRNDIAMEIYNMFSVHHHGKSTALFHKATGTYEKGTLFFRVRDIPSDDTKIPLRIMRTEQDAWAPPSNIVTAQRLNLDGESMLYLSPVSPVNAIQEKRIKDQEPFILITYEAIDKVPVSKVADSPMLESLSETERIKHKIINDFFLHEFIRDVGKGSEHLYKISEAIAKIHFSIPEIDGWCYPSVCDKRNVNVCLMEEPAKRKLRIKEITICTKIANGEGLYLTLHLRLTLVNGTFEYFRYDKESA